MADANARAEQDAAGATSGIGSVLDNLKSTVEDIQKKAGSMATTFQEAVTNEDVGQDEAFKLGILTAALQSSNQAITAGWLGVIAAGQIMGQMATAHSHGCRNLVNQQPKVEQ